MATVSDSIIDLGEKAAQSLLAVPLKKASAYYDTHLSLLKDAYKALQKDKEIKGQVDKFKKNMQDIRWASAELTAAIPKKPELPKKDAKAWGKKSKKSSYKEASKAHVDGVAVIIVALQDYLAKAESARKSIEVEIKKMHDAQESAKLKKGAWAKLQSVAESRALMDLLDSAPKMQTDIDKTIKHVSGLLTLYKKHMSAAQKAAIAAK